MVAAAKAAAKVLSRKKYPATQIRDGIHDKLRQKKEGIGKVRGTTEQIFVLRSVIEQCIECNNNLYACFGHFEKEFDSADRSAL